MVLQEVLDATGELRLRTGQQTERGGRMRERDLRRQVDQDFGVIARRTSAGEDVRVADLLAGVREPRVDQADQRVPPVQGGDDPLDESDVNVATTDMGQFVQ